MLKLPLPVGQMVDNSSDDNEGEVDNLSGITRTLNFTVNDSNGPVSGVTVTVGENSGTTGSAGGCTIRNVPDGQATVTVTKEGYDEYTDTITVSEDSTTFTVTLTTV